MYEEDNITCESKIGKEYVLYINVTLPMGQWDKWESQSDWLTFTRLSSLTPICFLKDFFVQSGFRVWLKSDLIPQNNAKTDYLFFYSCWLFSFLTYGKHPNHHTLSFVATSTTNDLNHFLQLQSSCWGSGSATEPGKLVRSHHPVEHPESRSELWVSLHFGLNWLLFGLSTK